MAYQSGVRSEHQAKYGIYGGDNKSVHQQYIDADLCRCEIIPKQVRKDECHEY